RVELAASRGCRRVVGDWKAWSDVLIRVVAATNRELSAMIARGEFREDLYYRPQVFEIPLPPLRERADDIVVLAEAFLAELGQLVGRPAAGFAKDASEALLAYRWPGNVRELRNVLE